VENIVDTRWGIQAVSVGNDDLYHGEPSILIVEFLGGAVRFNVLKIKPDLIPNAEADGRLAVSIRKFLFVVVLWPSQLVPNSVPRVAYEGCSLLTE